jgi:hypothetical protein
MCLKYAYFQIMKQHVNLGCGMQLSKLNFLLENFKKYSTIFKLVIELFSVFFICRATVQSPSDYFLFVCTVSIEK